MFLYIPPASLKRIDFAEVENMVDGIEQSTPTGICSGLVSIVAFEPSSWKHTNCVSQ